LIGRETEGSMKSTLAVLLFGCALLFAAASRAEQRPSQPEVKQAKPASHAYKVWTNDDIVTLRETSPISVIGPADSAAVPGAGAAAAGTNANPPALINKTPYVREQDVAWYEQEIGNRRERIEQLNDQMLQIENVRQSGQGISSAVPLDKSSSGITPEETIKSIENQKNQIQTEIDDLQDQAQRNGISRDAWR
jgi:hypothetical protein